MIVGIKIIHLHKNYFLGQKMTKHEIVLMSITGEDKPGNFFSLKF
jgi:hypothetical protein